MVQGLAMAWADRDHWPRTLQRKCDELALDGVLRFLADAAMATLRRRGPAFFGRFVPTERPAA